MDAESVECDVPALLQEAEQAVFRLSTQHTPGEWVSSETIAGELYPVLERLSEPVMLFAMTVATVSTFDSVP